MSTRAEPAAELQLTNGGSSDLDEVTEVMTAAFDERFGEAWTRSQCAGILPMPGVELVLARDSDGSLAGFSLYRTIADEAELLLLAVAPERRRRGIARRLLRHFLDRSRNGGAITIRDGVAGTSMRSRSSCPRRTDEDQHSGCIAMSKVRA